MTHRRTGLIPAVFIPIAFLVGCSVAPPEIVSIGMRLIVTATDAAGGRDERLSVFASVADDNGIGDIEYLFIVHDESELYWSLTGDAWQKHEEGNSIWIGSNSLDAPGTTLPRGDYRAVLIDLAGERTERAITLSAPETSAYKLPVVHLKGNSIELESSYTVNTAFFFDSGGNVVLTVPVTKGNSNLDSLWAKGQWRSGADYIAVYAFEPKAETGFFSWKIRLPD